MTEGVITQDVAKPEKETAHREGLSDKELNFRKLEAEREKDRAERDKEREARIRAEMQAESMQKELRQIQEMLKPKEIDPLDQLEDITDLDPKQLKAIFAQKEAQLERKAREYAKQALKEEQEHDKKTNFRDKLRDRYQDYDQFMNERVLAEIQEREPDAVDAISAIEDPYVRCEKAYKFIKNRLATAKPVEKPVESIQETVAENMLNPYLIPAGSASPPYGAVEFDTRSPSARKQAYEKLKAAQRRPIGYGAPAR